MSKGEAFRSELRNLLQYSDLSFHDFVELALYHPEFGYYAQAESPVGKSGDYVTSPTLSPVFSFALARLISDFVRRSGDEVATIVDVGCGDGTLIHSLYGELDDETRQRACFWGVDRSLTRIPADRRTSAVRFVPSLLEVERIGPVLALSNELFDAFPFARLVNRAGHLHELWVREVDGALDWSEHEAAPLYDDYFRARGLELQDGQFADITPEWGAFYGDLCRFVDRGLVVTFDYGFPQQQLFHPRIRRFGTAAAYAQQRVTRDLLAAPGEHDITAHINFTDLERAGEEAGFATLFFDRQAKFLLSLGITEHPLFTPSLELEGKADEAGLALLDARDDARRLVLPDGIGEDIRVLVQGRGVGERWSFQRPLF